MSSKLRFFKSAVLILFAAVLVCGCTGKPKPVRQTELALGTVCSVSLFDSKEKALLPASFSLISELENKISKNIPTSEISALNRSAGVSPVAVSKAVFELLTMAQKFSILSEGMFDVTIDPVVELWGIGTDHAAVPDAEHLKHAVALVDYRALVLDAENSTAFLPQKELAVDLGGIAKGYIADQVCDFLISSDSKGGIIDLGGNILAFGKKPDGSSFRIGLQDPFGGRGSAIGVVTMENGSMVTSGIYERFFEQDGKRYHHIFDVRTGYPVDNSLVGVSILSGESAVGDALSTAVFALGLEKGMALVERTSGVEAVFITKDKEVYISSGLKDSFTLTDRNFTMRGAF
ncbi:MAG: FAD:protein FMN transferase [Spirochaetia bacterium]|nr:FAD:protein FMN transferase [Spirochaetia bacterium]